jgi:hypothetical protein
MSPRACRGESALKITLWNFRAKALVARGFRPRAQKFFYPLPINEGAKIIPLKAKTRLGEEN